MFPACSAPRAPAAASLLLLGLTAALPLLSTAQTVLSPVVVVGSREALASDRVAADVVVIDADTIRASSADSIEDLLRRVAGLQLSRGGGPGQLAGLFVRGSASANTLVLIDGVRVGSATAGLTAFEGIGLAQVERIEVLRGPASSLYGADAVGGVVLINTRRGTDGSRFMAHSALGGNRSGAADAGISGLIGGVDVAASFSRERSDGVSATRQSDPFGRYNPDRDGFNRDTGQLSLGYTAAAGHRFGANLIDARLRSAYDGAVYPPPDFNTPDPSPDFRSRLHTRLASLDYRGVVSAWWTTSVLLAHAEDDAHSGAVGIASDASRYLTRRDQLSWQNTFDVSPAQRWVLALERVSERAASSSYAADVKRDNNALVVAYSGSFGAQSVQADLRHDNSTVYGGVNTGRLGWSMAVAPNWRVRALAGTSFHAPSFNDLVYPGYGVITIRPERGRSIEAGLNWQAGDSRAALTLYRNRVRELIAYQADPAQCPAGYTFGCASNVNRARLQGLTIDGSQRFGAWRIGGMLDFLRATDEANGQRLQRRAPRQGSLQADWDLGAWTLGADWLAVGARPDFGVTLGGYASVNLRAVWRLAPNWQVESKLVNATDKDVEPVRGYNDLRRQAWFGVRYEGAGL